ncbi:MAG: molybdopterin-dependent oxidoreductase [Bacillota bacterium]
MKTVTLWIDGKKIYADEGMTILETARKNGAHIPTLCYHPRLEPLGHCRICLVEVEGIAKPITACDNPVREGMVVQTGTPLINEMRREILSMTLSTHPYQDCLTCEKAGACELQEKAYCLKAALPEQLERAIPEPSGDPNPYIVRDESKCILCGRCIQVCRTGAGRFVYSLEGKGVNTRVVPARDGVETSLSEAGCIFCGQCVDICPVGALTEKGRAAGGREWELRSAAGVCLECSLGCTLERRAAGGALVKVTVPREGDQAAWLCRRGKFGVNPVSEGRITTPLIRDGGTLREAGYAEALQKTADALLKLKDKYGGSALAVLGDGRCGNEESYLLQKLARAVLHTNHCDLGTEPAWAQAVEAASGTAGPGAYGPTMAELQQADAVLVVGSGLAESNPVAQMALQHAGRFGRAAVVRVGAADDTGTAWESLHLKAGPAGEAAVLQAMTAALRHEPLDKAAGAAGVDPAALSRAARSMAGFNTYTVVCPSFWQAADAAAVEALLELAREAGQLKRGRCNLLLLSASGNARGIIENGGTPWLLPGMNRLDDPAARQSAEALFGASLPAAPGLDRRAVLEAAANGKVKGLFAAGTVDVGEALHGLEFFAVLCGDPDAVPLQADVVFPAPAAHEKAAAFTDAAGRVRCNTQAVTNTALKPEWEVITALAAAAGAAWHLDDLAAVRREMQCLNPGCCCCQRQAL